MTAARRALVVGAGGSRGALAGVRALARAGWEVAIAAPEPYGLAWSSRHAARRHRVPGPEQGAGGFAAAVGRLAGRYGYGAVLPAGDAELLALSAHRDELGGALPVAAHERVVRALDKLELARAAADAGVRAPRTWVPGAPWPVDGPVVVKPRLHFDPASAGHGTRIEARPAADAEEARALVDAVRAAGGEPVLQERLRGRLISFACVLDAGGDLLGAVQQEAVRTYPAGAGITAFGRTVAVDPELERRALTLLRALGWVGLCQLQLLDTGDGAPALIDLNGRLYGSLQAAVGAGLNLPALWAGVALGEAGAPRRARAGVTYQWLEGDLRRALAARAGFAQVLRGAAGAQHSVLHADDPAPALRYLILLAGRAARAAR